MTKDCKSLLFLIFFTAMPFRLPAQTVVFIQNSNPPGFISESANRQAGTSATTVDAPLTIQNYRFIYWRINWDLANAITVDLLERAINPVRFTILEDTTATAYYLPETQDADADGVPDWFEQQFYASIEHLVSSDTDADEFTLTEEIRRDYHPGLRDTIQKGGLSISFSTIVTAIQNPNYAHFESHSIPPGLLEAHSEIRLRGETVAIPDAYGVENGYRFSYWSLNGLRQEDLLGRALSGFSLTLNSNSQAEAAYIAEADDDDGDSLPDWFERHFYPNLNSTSNSDDDHDGFGLSEEFRRDLHPNLVDTIAKGGISISFSETTSVIVSDAFAFFEISSEPPGLLDETPGIELEGVVARGSNVATADSYGIVNGYRFTHWLLAGVPQRDLLGRGFGRLSTVADSSIVDIQAVFVPQDRESHADGVPDWFKLHFAYDPAHSVNADDDQDGFTLLEEYRRDYHPNLVDGIVKGGISYSLSAATSVIQNHDFAHVASSTNPPGFIATEHLIIAKGTDVPSPDVPIALNGYRFLYWLVNGIGIRDPAGLGIDTFTMTIDGNTAMEAKYLLETENIDHDNLPDWFEFRYFDHRDATEIDDPDGDGFVMSQEFQRDYHPNLVDRIVKGGISFSFSDVQRVNLSFFPRAQQILVDGSRVDFFASDPPNPRDFDIGSNASTALGDWDRDGDLDLFVGGANGELRVYRNDGSPVTLNLVPISDFAFRISDLPDSNLSPALGDWNGDGLDDLAIGSDDGLVRVYESDGSWEGEEESPGGTASHIVNTGSSVAIPGFGDLNGDEIVDLLVLLGDGTVRVYLNSSNPSSPFGGEAVTENLLAMPVPDATGIAAADIDSDGHIDVLISDTFGRIWEFRNDGNGSFSLRSRIFGGSYFGFANQLKIGTGDIDGDGDRDIVGGFAEGGLVLLRDPEDHIFVTPPVQTTANGEKIRFRALTAESNLSWSLHRNASGAAIDAETGEYLAGSAAGIDCVQVSSGNGLIGRAWINVISAGQTAAAGKAIIVSGRRSPNDNIWEATRHLGRTAYSALRYRGLAAENIYYLSHESQDVGVDGTPTLNTFAWALTGNQFADPATPSLLLYLADHGRLGENGGEFLFDRDVSISAPMLAALLADFQTTHPFTKITVIAECCYAADIVQNSSVGPGDNRVIIGSSGNGELAHFISQGLVSFSQAFWSDIALGLTVRDSFEDARDAMSRFQEPVLIDLDDQSGFVIGPDFIAGADRPVVGTVNPEITLTDTEIATIWAENVTGPSAIDRVWAVIVPPGYAAAGDAPVVDLPEVELRWSSGYQRWQADYSGFSEGNAENPYTVILFARDIWGNVSFPKETFVAQAGVRKRVIIFAGGNPNSEQWRTTRQLAETAWHTCRIRHIDPVDMRYFSEVSGPFFVDGLSTAANLHSAIANWSASAGRLDSLTIYLVGEGSSSGLVCSNGDIITAAALGTELNSLQSTTGSKINLIVETDYSGHFVRNCRSTSFPRVIVSSSGESQHALFGRNGWLAFGRWFWSGIDRGFSIRSAFANALVLARALGVAPDYQLDDDGDGVYNQKRDGRVAQNEFIGAAFVTGDDPPQIRRTSGAVYVRQGEPARLWVADVVTPDGSVPERVWAEIVPPNFDGESGELPTYLEFSWSEAEERFIGVFDEFGEIGRYTAYVYAGTPDDVTRVTDPVAIDLFFGVERPESAAPPIGSIPLLLANGDVHDLQLSSAEESATYRFLGKPGERLSFEIFGIPESHDVRLELLDGALHPITTVNDWGNGFGERIANWQPSAEGWYYVRASQVGVRGNTNFQMRSVTEQISTGEDPFEDDDAPELARYIDMTDGAFQEHNFHDEGDEDWVLFYADSEFSYSIIVENGELNADVVLGLYSEDDLNTPVQEADAFEPGGSEQVNLLEHHGGIFYVRVRQFDRFVFGIGTSYRLRVFQTTSFLSGFLVGLFKNSVGSPLTGRIAITGVGNFPVPNDGIYFVELRPNTYQLTGSALGFQEMAKTVSVAAGAITQQDFVLEPIAAINQNPTLDAIGNPEASLEDAGAQTINLSGIGAGGGESQALTVSASSNNSGLIPNPTVNYTSPNTTGSVSYTPVGNASGSAMITVTVRDAGLDGTAGNGDDGTTNQTFTVTVNVVNDAPTLAAITDPPAILEDAGAQTLDLTGIGAGGGESQALIVAATSDNTGLIPNPTVTYISPNATGSLSYTPVADASGTAVITVTVRDAGLDGTAGNGDDASTSHSFMVTVTAVNDVPTLAVIADPTAILEDAGAQTVNLIGITAGGGESQTLAVAASSDNSELIPSSTISYISPNMTGSLTYTPVANASGSADITVTVTDTGLDGVLGTADDGSVSRSFTVIVDPANDDPMITSVPILLATEETSYTYNITTSDDDGGAMTITAPTLPSWLTLTDNGNGTGLLSGTPSLDDIGSHNVVLAATDQVASTQQSFEIVVSYKKTLDIDRNGVAEAGKDGLLIIRYLFGFNGPELTTGAVGDNCEACEPSEVLPILNHAKSIGWLDVDGDTQHDALTDGILLIRYLAGATETALTSHAVAAGCGRCTANAIIGYLNNFVP